METTITIWETMTLHEARHALEAANPRDAAIREAIKVVLDYLPSDPEPYRPQAQKRAEAILAAIATEMDGFNPAIEAMADLERTFECNPEKLPLWLKEALADKYQKGYYKGRIEALEEYNKSVAFRYYDARPLCWEPGGTCTNPQMDCINCPRKTTGGGFNTNSGTSTATLHGNTSATDGKEHNPSFTD